MQPFFQSTVFYFFSFLTLIISLDIKEVSATITRLERRALTFNIISHSLTNGAGKQIDATLIKEKLKLMGHHVTLCDFHRVDDISPADVNIFLAQHQSNWLSKGKLNWFIPNAEFCIATPNELRAFDLILCKTQECYRIFKKFNTHLYYLGFKSPDRFQPLIAKNFSKCIHVAGKSHMKGTKLIMKAWRKYRHLPPLVLIRHTAKISKFANPKNVLMINKRISDKSLLAMQNECGFHLCPSETEGFGHYLMEAMSTCAIVITTDAPPMNEFIQDSRCLVKYTGKKKKNYADTFQVDEDELAATISLLQHLPDEELKAIGECNREQYLKRTIEFDHNFENLIHGIENDLFLKKEGV